MRQGAVLGVAAVVAVSLVYVTGAPPAAADDSQPAKIQQTVTIIYWPANATGQVQFSANRGTLNGNGTLSLPFWILDYRLTTPWNVGFHLDYGPYEPASGLANPAQSTSAGLWNADVFYNWTIPLKPPAVIIFEPFAGYGETHVNNSVTTALGNLVTESTVYSGIYLGANAILPLSEHFFIVGSGTWYPWSNATFNLNAPGVGLSGSASASAPQYIYSVSFAYQTSSLWTFSLGYEWYGVSVSGVPLSTMTARGETIGGAFCPCNSQFSGPTFAVGKTF